MTDKMYISWNEYQDIIESFTNTLTSKEANHKFHLVSIYRGSLLMGQHISNVLDIPLSIVKFQRLDSDDTEVQFIHNAGIKEDDIIILLDDIFDTGETIYKVSDFFKRNFVLSKIQALTLSWNNKHTSTLPEWVTSVIKTEGKWVVFPWET